MSEHRQPVGFSRRALLAGTLGASVGAIVGASAGTRAPGRFRFVHLTDLHIQPELGAAEGVRMAVKKVLSLRPRPNLALLGGDLLMDLLDVTRDRADTQVRLLQEELSRLEMPCHYAVGNHDVFGWARRDARPGDAGYGKGMYAERVVRGPLFRAFDHGGWRFYVLDSIQQAEGGWRAAIDEAQMQWLTTDLRSAPSTQPKVLMSHVPLVTAHMQFTVGSTAAARDSTVVANGKAVCDLAAKHNVRVVLQGHTHVVEEVSYAGTRYVTGGAVCGNWWRGKRLGLFDEGFAVYDVDGTRADWHYIGYGWRARSA